MDPGPLARRRSVRGVARVAGDWVVSGVEATVVNVSALLKDAVWDLTGYLRRSCAVTCGGVHHDAWRHRKT